MDLSAKVAVRFLSCLALLGWLLLLCDARPEIAVVVLLRSLTVLFNDWLFASEPAEGNVRQGDPNPTSPE